MVSALRLRGQGQFGTVHRVQPELSVSVVVRSYNRLPELCRLLAVLLDQRYPNFEVIVVEQSTSTSPDAEKLLAGLTRDPRLRVLRHPPLGGSRARNTGVRAARGEILLFIDDDDMPIGREWIATHVAFYADPLCLGVTGRQMNHLQDLPSPWYARRALTRCMGFMPLLKLPTTYVRHDQRVAPVWAVHGTNGSLRREAVERFGGWDEDTSIEDETSFALRAGPAMRFGEYFAFEPGPVVLRGLDVPGGLAKRYVSAAGFFSRLLDFVHTILGRYMPWRVILLYPVYLVVLYGWTIGWVWIESHKHRGTVLSKLAGMLLFTLQLPWVIARTIVASLRKRRHAMTSARLFAPVHE